MRAAVYAEYGPPEVVRLREVPEPTAGPADVLVRVRATTVTIGDTIMRSLRIPGAPWQRLPARLWLGYRHPKRSVLGMELAGDVVEVGSRVTRFAPGDAVLASTFAVGFGGHAEYACLPETGVIVAKPELLGYERAAALPGAGMTALRCLRKAGLQPGQRILVYGASGAVGSNAVQLAAHHFGATVTAVCSTANLGWVRELGAADVLDYTQSGHALGGPVHDVVFDAVGKLSAAMARGALRPGGIRLNVLKDSGGDESREDLQLLVDLVLAGRLLPVIDRTYPLDRIVQAHRYVEAGHKKGNVVIVVA